jgi:hypothetical protein
MDVFKESAQGRHYLTYKIIGGILDFRFFVGERNPGKVVERLHFYSGGCDDSSILVFRVPSVAVGLSKRELLDRSDR